MFEEKPFYLSIKWSGFSYPINAVTVGFSASQVDQELHSNESVGGAAKSSVQEARTRHLWL
jgi:hypothetical protein